MSDNNKYDSEYTGRIGLVCPNPREIALRNAACLGCGFHFLTKELKCKNDRCIFYDHDIEEKEDNMANDKKDLGGLLDVSKLGFKAAFKATLGFYAAQFLVTILGLLFLVSGCAAIGGIAYHFLK